MARRTSRAIPAAPRKTLLEWIESNDGDTTSGLPPSCSKPDQALHARICSGFAVRPTDEPLQPPPGLRLAPLG
jgi:hypothetical protein